MNYTAIAQNMSSISSLDDVLKMANTVTGDTFWTGIFWMLSIIILISTLAFGFEIAMLMTLFASFVFGLFLLYMGLISGITFGITEALFFFMTLYLVYTTNKAQ